jgi:hypothetical protein
MIKLNIQNVESITLKDEEYNPLMDFLNLEKEKKEITRRKNQEDGRRAVYDCGFDSRRDEGSFRTIDPVLELQRILYDNIEVAAFESGDKDVLDTVKSLVSNVLDDLDDKFDAPA